NPAKPGRKKAKKDQGVEVTTPRTRAAAAREAAQAAARLAREAEAAAREAKEAATAVGTSQRTNRRLVLEPPPVEATPVEALPALEAPPALVQKKKENTTGKESEENLTSQEVEMISMLAFGMNNLVYLFEPCLCLCLNYVFVVELCVCV
ncbi:unnamed protein product, partial [Urochloa humidicola]